MTTEPAPDPVPVLELKGTLFSFPYAHLLRPLPRRKALLHNLGLVVRYPAPDGKPERGAITDVGVHPDFAP